MTSKSSIIALLAGLIVATSFVGAAAFTTASAQRDVTVGIEADNTAIIGLQAGNADAAHLNNGQLVIEPDKNANGLNQNARFTYGDNSSAKSSQAFNITNNDDVAHDFTLSYSQSQGSGTVAHVVAYDSNGDGTVDSTTTVTETSSATVTLNSGETAYVVVTVNTDTGTTDISGTLSIDV